MKIIQPTPREEETLRKNGVVPQIDDVPGYGTDYGLNPIQKLKEDFDNLQIEILKEKDPFERAKLERKSHEIAVKLGIEFPKIIDVDQESKAA